MDPPPRSKEKGPAFKVIIFCLIAAGVFFRFNNLGMQSFWHDESITALHLAGHTKSDVDVFLFSEPREVRDLIEFGKPKAGQFQRVWDVWVADQPEKAPLFYMMEYFWAITIGGGVIAMRLLPALLSLLQLPAFYWLGRQAFREKEVAWIMTALVALSPSAVTYAQEAREYSLFTATIAFMSAAFLKASNSPKGKDWILYGLMLLLSLYTSMLSLFVWIAQLSLLVLTKRSKQVLPFLLVSVVCLALFSPWLLINLPHATTGYEPLYWMGRKFDPAVWLLCVASNFWLVFLLPSVIPKPAESTVVAITVLTVLYSIFRLAKSAPQPGRAYLLLMMLDCSVPFILADLCFGGIRSITFKYFSPVHVGMIACLAYAISFHVLKPSVLRARLAQGVCVIALAAALVASDIGWTNAHTSFLRAVSHQESIYKTAQILNRDYKAPPVVNGEELPTTLVSDWQSSCNNGMHLMALSRELNPDIRLLHYRQLDPKLLPGDLIRFFYFNPDKQSITTLSKNGFKVQKVKRDLNLWIVTRLP